MKTLAGYEVVEISGPIYEIIEPGTVVDQDIMIGMELRDDEGNIMGEVYAVDMNTQTYYARVQASKYYLN